jgi:hypothetical protein
MQRREPKIERRFSRFRLAAPVAFKWWSEEGVGQGLGYSRDISVGGIFVHTKHCPPTSSILRYEVLLQSADAPEAFIRIRAAGRVLRTEPLQHGKKRDGFAVQCRKALLGNA